ncbi:MAG TPA: hypothetical protein VJ768_02820, partial [Anaerolineales bacterium]|nr:hypothetical protein [Anaerolineales bacterium]
YNTIDRLPLVSLPRASGARVEEIQASVAETQENIEALRQGVRDFRAGAADQIGRVTEAADRVTTAMDNLSSDLSELDSNLAAVQDFSIRMQSRIPTLFTILAIVATLFFVYVGYTQVEVIRLFLGRWRLLGEAVEPVAAAEMEDDTMDESAGN